MPRLRFRAANALLLLISFACPFTAKAISFGLSPERDARIWKSAVAIKIDFGTDLYKTYHIHGYCSGILISDSLVLTAGHCLELRNGNPHRPLAIEFFDETGTKIVEERSVISAALPKAFNPIQLYADIGVVKFSGGLPAGRIITSVLQDISLIKNGMIAIDAGFGRDENQHTGFLKMNDFIIHSINPTDIEISGKSKDVNVCGGDSGGPLLIEKDHTLFVIGINSRSEDHDCNLGISSAWATLLPRYSYAWVNKMIVDNLVEVKTRKPRTIYF